MSWTPLPNSCALPFCKHRTVSSPLLLPPPLSISCQRQDIALLCCLSPWDPRIHSQNPHLVQVPPLPARLFLCSSSWTSPFRVLPLSDPSFILSKDYSSSKSFLIMRLPHSENLRIFPVTWGINAAAALCLIFALSQHCLPMLLLVTSPSLADWTAFHPIPSGLQSPG